MTDGLLTDRHTIIYYTRRRVCQRMGESLALATELYVGTGRSHAHSGLTPTHRHLACVLLLYCQCPIPVLLWQLWSGSATYQICFRLTIPNPNPNPKNKEKQNDTGIKFNIKLLHKYPSNMADRLRQLYHIYDWCEYFQLKIEFSGSSRPIVYVRAVIELLLRLLIRSSLVLAAAARIQRSFCHEVCGYVHGCLVLSCTIISRPPRGVSR